MVFTVCKQRQKCCPLVGCSWPFLMMLRFPSAQREYLIDLIGFFFIFFLRHLVASRTAEVKKTICFVKSPTNNTS